MPWLGGRSRIAAQRTTKSVRPRHCHLLLRRYLVGSFLWKPNSGRAVNETELHDEREISIKNQSEICNAALIQTRFKGREAHPVSREVRE